MASVDEGGCCLCHARVCCYFKQMSIGVFLNPEFPVKRVQKITLSFVSIPNKLNTGPREVVKIVGLSVS